MSTNFKTNKKINPHNNNLKQITFNNNNIRSKRLLKLIDFGESNVIEEQVEKLLPEKILKKISDKFYNIDNIKIKLRSTLISKFIFNDIGRIYIFDILNFDKDNKIILVHTNLHSFMCKENGVDIKKKIIHIYLPTDDICLILSLIRKIISIYTKRIKSLFFKLKINKKYKDKNELSIANTAILIHGSFNYGENLYYKNHYFSSKNESKLNIINVILLSLANSNNPHSKAL